VRKKLEETFGQFELAHTPNPQTRKRSDLVTTHRRHPNGGSEIEYQKEGEQTWSKRVVSLPSMGAAELA
jgi:hypothetical protein